jgi:phosphoribosylformylglycinamidine synthase
VLLLRAPGTNCDRETEYAWVRAGARVDSVHVRRLLEDPSLLRDYQVLTIPGGFSYGDDVAAGRIFAVQLRRGATDELRAFVESAKLVLGICNGFQVLVQVGLLPGGAATAGRASTDCSITANQPPGFQDRWVTLQAGVSPCVFTEAGRLYEMPIAHGEGRVVFRDQRACREVVAAGQNALSYHPAANSCANSESGLVTGTDSKRVRQRESSASSPDAAVSLASVASGRLAPNSVAADVGGHNESGREARGPFSAVASAHAAADAPEPRASADASGQFVPYNPNGSEADIAGICDPTGRVLGLMPHPERHIDPIQHPCWTSRERKDDGDGLAIFRRAVQYFA